MRTREKFYLFLATILGIVAVFAMTLLAMNGAGGCP